MDWENEEKAWETPRESRRKPEIRPSRNRDVVFAIGTLFGTLLTSNCVLEGGMNLGYTVSLVLLMGLNVAYLWNRLKWSLYAGFYLAAALLLGLGFARSDDGTMKFFAYLGMTFSWYQALMLLRGVGSRNPGSIGTIFDMLRHSWGEPMKELAKNIRGLFYCARGETVERRKTGGVMLGVLCAVPVLAVVLPLLVRSDAAFEGLMDRTIFADMQILFLTVAGGVMLFFPKYSRGVSLSWSEKPEGEEKPWSGRVQTLTVNTFLGVISFFYVLYLLSQLAYFFSAFAGILPEGYTASDYARRGFFEMCRICAINFAIIALSAGLVKRGEKGVPRSTRVLCLFVCLFSLVLVAASASKMSLYIGVYGLTRLRVLTSVFMLGLGIAVAALGIWLLRPRFPYMKVILSAALILGTLTLWADVDTQVAKYNVESYRSGCLAEVDMTTLSGLKSGSTEYIALLLDDPDPEVSGIARDILVRRVSNYYSFDQGEDGVLRLRELSQDLRGWNWMEWHEKEIIDGLLERLKPYF